MQYLCFGAKRSKMLLRVKKAKLFVLKIYSNKKKFSKIKFLSAHLHYLVPKAQNLQKKKQTKPDKKQTEDIDTDKAEKHKR